MKKRLTKIITRTGDKGTTGLGDGTRVSKASQRMIVIGDIDELNAHVGLFLTTNVSAEVRELLTRLQHELFELGGEICIPGTTRISEEQISEEQITYLEEAADHFNADLPPLTNFILPGGSPSAAYAHIVRAVARRLERGLVQLAEAEAVSDTARRYVNRLSDLFFILARVCNRHEGKNDVLWSQAFSIKKPSST